jgi:hypothetical protein
VVCWLSPEDFLGSKGLNETLLINITLQAQSLNENLDIELPSHNTWSPLVFVFGIFVFTVPKFSVLYVMYFPT